MSDTHTFAELADRIDRLLLRHEELQRTNELLSTEVDSLQAERDLLRSKLAAARARIVTLLERLTAASETGVDSSSSDPSSS
jgi:chromosome segregation ATPase